MAGSRPPVRPPSPRRRGSSSWRLLLLLILFPRLARLGTIGDHRHPRDGVPGVDPAVRHWRPAGHGVGRSILGGLIVLAWVAGLGLWRRARGPARGPPRILTAMPRTARPARPVRRCPGIPARPARDRRLRGRRRVDGRADRPPPRGHHPGRQRDVPPARGRRARRPRRRARTAPDHRRPRRRRWHLPPARPARVAADERRRARLGRVGRGGDAPPGRHLAAGRGAPRRDARPPRDLPARQPDRCRDRRSGGRPGSA